MSYSRTYGRSRGFHEPVDRNAQVPPGSGNESDQQSPQASQQNPPPRQERRDGYTVIRPDEKKRAHLQEVAKRETEQAEARSEARRPQHISERPQKLGGATEHYTAILQKQRAVSTGNKSLEMKKKREQWQREKREKEEKEIEQKKAKARAQAERNEVLRAVRAQEREERHADEHRRKNSAFLDRLEYGY